MGQGGSRRSAYAVHGALGRALGAALSWVLLTGALATLGPDLEAWIEPRGAEVLDEDALARLEHWSRRTDLALTTVVLPAGEERAMAIVRTRDGTLLRAPLREDGTPRALLPIVGARQLLRDAHRNLLLGHPGLYVVTPFAFVLVVLVLSGLTSQRRFVLRPTGRATHARTATLHRALGTYGLAGAVLFSTTGLVYVAETIVEDAGGSLEVEPPREAMPTEPHASLARLLARASEAAPTLHPERIVLPRERDRPVLVLGPGPAPLVRGTASFVALDARGEVLASHEAGPDAPMDLIADLADPLHFGTLGGRATRWLWALAGLLLVALAVAGLAAGRARARHEADHATERRATIAVCGAVGLSLAVGLLRAQTAVAVSGWVAATILASLWALTSVGWLRARTEDTTRDTGTGTGTGSSLGA
ncbi:MAG: hypothetical protein OHK0013_25130 [Sandaracinaceae bacterium]